MLEDECVTDEEETYIQSFILDDAEVPASTLYSSAKDTYASVAYTDLSDEVKMVTDLKCFTYIGQLLQLVSMKCRVRVCAEDIDITFHTNCGYGVKLTWMCKNQQK